MNVIRNLVRPQVNLQSCIRRYYGSTGAKRPDKGTGKKGSSKGNKKKEKKTPAKPQFSWFDARKYSHNLPGNDVMVPFEPVPCVPNGVFRATCNEIIGPLAGKCAYYRNPEYYSFHHMSFFDLHMALLRYRKPQIKSGRKPLII